MGRIKLKTMENEQALSIVLRLKDEASKQLDTFRSKVDSISKSMGPAMDISKKFALALAGVGAVAVGFGVVAVKAAMESEVQMAKFAATMKTIPGATDASTKAILANAKAMQKKGFDDDESANVMAKLYQRTNDVNKAMKLTALAADLSRAKNISLSDAGNLVNMTLSGNQKALKAYGIEISDTLSPVDALAELQKKVAGQSDAYTETLQGKLTVLKGKWDDIVKVIGKDLLPLLKPLIDKAILLAEQFTVWYEKIGGINGILQASIQFMKDYYPAILAVAGAIAGLLMPAIIGWTTAMAGLLITMAPWLIGGAVIGGIVAGIVWIVKNWDMIRAKTIEIWGAIKQYFKDVWAGIKAYAQEAIDFIMDKVKAVTKAWNDMIALVSKPFKTASGVIKNTASGAWDELKYLTGKLTGHEHGGTVIGPRGMPVPIMAHGGETILPAGQSRGGGGMNININMNYPQFNNADDIDVVRKQVEGAFRDVIRIYKLQPA